MMLRYCIAVLLLVLTWFPMGDAWAAEALAPGPQAAETAAANTYSTEEISTFASAYQQVQSLRLRAEGEMTKAVEAEGLTVDRFNAIAALQIDDPTDEADAMAKIAAKAKISKQENKQFKAAVDRIIAIRQGTEADMEKAIEDLGMAITTFNTMLEQSADDTTLQRQISDEIVRQTLASGPSAS